MPRPEVFRSVVATGNMKETAPAVVENTIAVSSKNGVVANVDYTDFNADVKMTPATTVINRYSVKALGGSLSGAGTMEPKASKFNVSSKIENVNLAEYFKYKAPALADMMVGRINMDIEVAGQGKDWDAIQKNLTGKGGAVVLEGALTNVNIANQIVSGLQGLPMVPPDITQRMKLRNPKLFAENKTMFQNLSSKFQIANGRINTPDLKLSTSEFTLSGDGWFSLTKEMKLASTLTLSQKMASDIVAEVPVARYLQGADGRITVPLDLTGSVLKPTVQVNAADMQALFQKAMLSQGQKQVESQVKSGVKGLFDNLGKKNPPPPKPAPAKPDSIKP
jgi:hypothetical protein